MAGFAIGALPYFLQYQQQAQQQAIQKQQADMQLAAFQQQQQDRQRQQATEIAMGNTYASLPYGMPPPPPQAQMAPPQQTPAPGQPSRPMIQPGQVPPGSLGPGESQVNLSPLPPGGVRGAMPPAGTPPLPSFRPMPTSPPPQQAAQPASIGSPPPQAAPAPQQPQSGLTWGAFLQSAHDQRLTGQAFYDYMQAAMPVLDYQAKQQAAQVQQQFNRDFKVSQLNATEKYHEDMLNERGLDRRQRSMHEDQLLGVQQQRLVLEAQRLSIERQRLALQNGTGAPAPENLKPDAQGNLPAPKGVAGYSSEAIKALGEDYAQRGSAAFTGMGRGKSEDAARAAAINYGTAVNAQAGKNVATNKAQYTADTAGARSNAVQAAKVDAAANALVQKGGIGDQFQESIDALNRTGVPFANEAQMEILRKSNDPRVAAYDTAQNGVVSEAAQILGRGTLTVNSMEEARRVVSGWKTSEAARAGLAQLKREAATTIKASREEVARSAQTPKKPEAAPASGGLPAGWTVTEH